MGDARLGVHDGPGCIPDTVNGFRVPARGLHGGAAATTPGASPCRCCGTSRPDDRQQRVRRDHPHAEQRSSTRSPASPRLYPRALRAEIDAINALVYDGRQQRRVPLRVRHGAGRLRARPSTPLLDARRARGSARARSATCRRPITEADWRLFTTLVRFDAVYYGHFKCNLRRLVDYPEPVGLHARALPGAGCRRDREPGAHQAALLREPSAHQPDADRPQGTGAGLHECSPAGDALRRLVVVALTNGAPPPSVAFGANGGKARLPHRGSHALGAPFSPPDSSWRRRREAGARRARRRRRIGRSRPERARRGAERGHASRVHGADDLRRGEELRSTSTSRARARCSPFRGAGRAIRICRCFSARTFRSIRPPPTSLPRTVAACASKPATSQWRPAGIPGTSGEEPICRRNCHRA